MTQKLSSHVYTQPHVTQAYRHVQECSPQYAECQGETTLRWVSILWYIYSMEYYTVMKNGHGTAKYNMGESHGTTEREES